MTSVVQEPATDMPLMTVREAARVLRWHPSTVHRRIYAGDITAVMIGRSIRIRRDDLDRFIASQPSAARPTPGE